MTGRIRDEAIRTVRERASLSEVVSDVIALRRRGRSAVGLCPFHAEKTPSFTVSEDRGFFHCFGCGEHGDVFGFVMKTQSLTFPEAVRRVADRFGVSLPEEAGEPARRREPLTAANAAAAAFFQAELRGPGGGRARAYLRERGLSEEVIERFGLGWAPGAGEALARHLRTKGVPLEDALTAGLVMRRDRPDGAGGVLDRFRERIMFPITDTSGKVIAFGGRILPGRPAGGEPPPKYLNSAESPVFRKGHTLYGLALARDAIRKADRAIVVEGYLDLIALAQAGIGEVVAPLGTALTAEQLRLLRRFTETVIACFDGDLAGRRAAARSFPVFLEAGLWGRGAFLPAGEDPDTFVRAQGRVALEGVLAAAEPLVEAFVGELAGPKAEAVGRYAQAAREVARLLKRVREPHEFDVLVRLAAQRLGVREETLRSEGAPGVAPAAAPDEPHAPGAEATLVELMAEDATLAERVAACGIIAEFQHPEWRRTAEALARGEETDRMAVVQSLPRGMRDRLARRLLAERPDAAAERDRALADCIAKIRRRGQRGEERRLRDEIRTAEARGDAAAVEAAMRRLKQLMDEAQAEKART
ncbi:MAG: DNA primase [Deltaproteobacteria bacterium]|nr:MAG: DNA primase [Deltaproteobacteria bacterium]